ncbi:hypothetical protein F4819DRAFT_486100 [Hypoxylon fuscum]|nr:hypothetical protein F4819DRAFT_486100 [Hypoxylon fuscum]
MGLEDPTMPGFNHQQMNKAFTATCQGSTNSVPAASSVGPLPITPPQRTSWPLWLTQAASPPQPDSSERPPTPPKPFPRMSDFTTMNPGKKYDPFTHCAAGAVYGCLITAFTTVDVIKTMLKSRALFVMSFVMSVFMSVVFTVVFTAVFTVVLFVVMFVAMSVIFIVIFVVTFSVVVDMDFCGSAVGQALISGYLDVVPQYLPSVDVGPNEERSRYLSSYGSPNQGQSGGSNTNNKSSTSLIPTYVNIITCRIFYIFFGDCRPYASLFDRGVFFLIFNDPEL